MYEISREPLNVFAPNSHLVPRSYEFEDQGQRSRPPGTKTAFSALSAACVRFMFGKTSLASSLTILGTAKPHRHHRVACPLLDVAVPTNALEAC